MNPVDTYIVLLLNSFARKSWALDAGVSLLQNLDLFKGGVIVGVFWWQWMRADGEVDQRRQRLLGIFLSSFLSLFCARIMAYMLPFRLRPIHTSQLPFVLPYTVNPESLEGWSSFPSDHAALFCTFAFGLFFVSRKVAYFTLVYTVFVILIPRVYLGLHWPTDLLAGLGIGAFIGGFAAIPVIQNAMTRSLEHWRQRFPLTFLVALILMTFELGVLFVDIRNISRYLYEALWR